LLNIFSKTVFVNEFTGVRDTTIALAGCGMMVVTAINTGWARRIACSGHGKSTR
jgi:hypothetical protein